MLKIRTFVLLFFLLITLNSFSQNLQLSPLTEISVVVVDPGTAELFEVFGHPAIRINDPIKRIDLAYNYGIFDFDQPYFYLNFTRGYLNYMVAAWPYSLFEDSYIRENRTIKEYVLNLTQKQKQTVFDFLEENIKPENRHYFYDYFYDNCSTRIWEVFEKTLGKDIHFDQNFIQPEHSFRTFVDSLTVNKPWGDFGIDLCLGLPMDKKLNSYEYMFLPEFLGRSIDHATITINGKEEPFVKESRILFQSTPTEQKHHWLTPNILFWSIFIIILLLTLAGIKYNKKWVVVDILIFGAAGLVGLLLFILWTATDHAAAANNLNIIWADPLYLIGFFYLFKNKMPERVRKLFMVFGILLFVFVILWPINPQGINIAVIPISLALCLRAWYIFYTRKS